MRIIHIAAAIGIALLANSIEPDWLGALVLFVLLGGYTIFAVRLIKKGKS